MSTGEKVGAAAPVYMRKKSGDSLLSSAKQASNDEAPMAVSTVILDPLKIPRRLNAVVGVGRLAQKRLC